MQTDTSGSSTEPGAARNLRSFRLLIEFDGSEFAGWQIQRRGERTVQGCLTEAARRLSAGDGVRVTGSSRTDSGVHAEGLVANLRLESELGPEALRRALNGILPADVVILELAEAAPDFDARRDARWKAYRYAIWNAPDRSPRRARRALHVRQELDLAAMRLAASQLVGRHDFRCFQAAGSAVERTVRTLYRLEVLEAGPGDVAIEVEGTGFLRYMVRNIVGTLLEVGRGRRAAGEMSELISARDRARAGPTVAAHGLTLVRVGYSPHLAAKAPGSSAAAADAGLSPEGRPLAGGPAEAAAEHRVFSEKSQP